MASGSNTHRFDEKRIGETYRRIESRNLLAQEDRVDPEDIVAQEARANPWAWGIWASMRLTGFLKLLNRQNAVVTIEQLMFALELTAMNWYNAEGLPVSADKISAARKAAREYYKKGMSG